MTDQSVLTSLALVAGGLILLGFGGEVLLRGAVSLATRLRLTPAVIGLTVVAAGTSVPELAVSAIAAAQGRTDIAFGNVVGSNVANIALILGLCALVRPLAIGGNIIRLEYPVLALVTLMTVALAEDGIVNRLDAVLLVAVYVCFTAYMVTLVRDRMNAIEEREFGDEVQEFDQSAPGDHRLPVLLALITLGVLLLAGGASVTVEGAVGLATRFGLSERVIGLTIVAIGTSLPEVVTSLVSVARGRDDVAIGNIIGSNLFNLLGILGVSALIAPLSVHPGIVASDNWWMLGVTIGLFPIMMSGRRITRLEGGLLLSVYVIYLGQLLVGS
ncbi:MAG: calcium/sodium antiporter [Acidobacteria bacterium]|nr:calcium/sodium antiporter [Acidobacteriota bacterium]